MMKNIDKILACVDRSGFSEYVADYASWAAQRLEAPLEVLHIFDNEMKINKSEDFSGAIGFNAKENLLDRLSSEDEAKSKIARNEARIFLNNLRERALANGHDLVDIRKRTGELEETLVEQENGVQLYVLGRRGSSAEHTERDLGRNIERVIRALRKPILAVTEAFHVPRQIMVAFNGSSTTRRGIDMISKSPLFRGLPIHVVMAGKEKADANKQLDWAKNTLESAGFEAICSMISGDPEQVITQYIKDKEIDMLVMGAYANSPIKRMLFGSKTSDLLRSSSIPTLVLR